MKDVSEPATETAPLAGEARRPTAFSIPQLLAIVTLVTLAPLVLFGAGALYLWDRSERQASLERLSAHAQSLSQAVNREIRGYRETAESVAASPALEKGEIDVFWRFANKVASRIGGHFVLIDANTRQVWAQHAEAKDAEAPGYAFARTAGDIMKAVQTGETVVTNFHPQPDSGDLQFTILTPVAVGGRAAYVLGYAPPGSSILKVVQETYRPDGWLAAVLDGDGAIIARSVSHGEFVGRRASADFFARISDDTGLVASTDLQGRASMAAWHTSRDNWKVIVWAPTEVLDSPTHFAVGIFLAAAVLAIILSIVASWYASRLIHDPTIRLVRAARQLGDGEVFHFSPTRMAEANAIGVSLAAASNVIHRREADLRASQSHTNLIMRELSHRSKNLLALVQAMARQSARSSTNFADFQVRFIERLQSLSMSHDLLVKTDWTSVPLRDLVHEQLRTFIDNPANRLVLSGGHLMLTPEAAQNLGMVFHELGSNAVKHGCFSVPDGLVHIDWRVEDGDDPMLWLQWRESGGPPVRPPTTQGFGTTIIKKLIPASLRGKADLSWDEQGFAWTLRAPLESVSSPAGPTVARRQADDRTPPPA